MKRDLDLVRKILFVVEARPSGMGSFVIQPIEGYSSSDVNEHVAIMIKHGLLEGKLLNIMDSGGLAVSVTRLSFQGHDFIDSIRNDTIWNKLMKQAKDKMITGSFEAFIKAAIAEGEKLVSTILT